MKCKASRCSVAGGKALSSESFLRIGVGTGALLGQTNNVYYGRGDGRRRRDRRKVPYVISVAMRVFNRQNSKSVSNSLYIKSKDD